MLDRLSNSAYLSFMNTLSVQKKVQIISLLVEGMSLRTAARVSDISRTTILKLLVDLGKACQQFHNDNVINLKSDRIQCDKIWSFVGCKEKAKEQGANGDGDVWTWTALDADTKMIVSWLVGDRNVEAAPAFMQDVRYRIVNRIQLTTDGHRPYLQAVKEAFDYDVDYAMLIKMYGGSEGTKQTESKYSPGECTGSKKTKLMGDPRPKFISTSFVERQNLTMKMHMRRFTRLTHAFIKKVENHCYAIALHFVYYNFCNIHQSLSVTPAMQAGLTKKPMTIEDIANLVVEPVAQKKEVVIKRKILNLNNAF